MPQKYSACTNDLRISWQTKEQNFTSVGNYPKMAECYVNAHKMSEK